MNSTPWYDSPKTIRWIVLALICGITVLRWIYLACWSTLDLAPDEAHYWDWSRHLDWSYYSKGPMIAWIIHAGVALFGGLSESLTGSLTMAVRLPSCLFGAAFLWGLYLLSSKILPKPWMALFVVFSAITLPPIAAGSLLMTIDSPFTCFWCWATVFGYLAVEVQKKWAWPLAGLMVCLGILSKYTMALWLFSFGLYLLFSPIHRKLLYSLGFWIMVGVAGLSSLPILYWNSQNDWVTFKHVAVQAGVAQSTKSAAFRWWGPFEYAGGQAALLLLYWFIVWAGGIWQTRPWVEKDSKLNYLWWLSIPTFCVFGISSLKASGQLNWPITTYISGLILGVLWLHRQLWSTHPFWRIWQRTWLILIWLIGISMTVVIHRSEIIYPIVTRVIPEPTPENPFPIRKLDPTCRLKGWRELALEVNRLRQQMMLQTGQEPIIAGLNWQIPGEIGVYIPDHPPVYSIGLIAGDRHSQYDHWRPNPLDDAQEFIGKTFLIVGQGQPALTEAFDKVEPPLLILHQQLGQPISGWTIWVAHGFRGFDKSKYLKGRGRY